MVTRNAAGLAAASVQSLRAHTQVRHELLVVDNASTDGAADAVRRAHPSAVVMDSPINLGFAGAVNLAARQATGEFLLLLNPDTLVLPGAVDDLVAFARQHRDRGIWGGCAMRPDGTVDRQTAFARPGAWSAFCRATGLSRAWPGSSLFNPEALPAWDRRTGRMVDGVSGCFFLIERRLWDRLGGFDPAFFMYGEEADLCFRARPLGARPTFVPSARIVHYVGQSEPDAARRTVQMLCARIRLARRHLPRWQAGTAIWLTRLGPMLRRLGAVLKPDSPEAVRSRTVWADRHEWWQGYR